MHIGYYMAAISVLASIETKTYNCSIIKKISIGK